MLYETCKHWFFYNIALIITPFSACEEGKCCKKSEISLFSQRNFHFRCDKIIFSKKKTTSKKVNNNSKNQRNKQDINVDKVLEKIKEKKY